MAVTSKRNGAFIRKRMLLLSASILIIFAPAQTVAQIAGPPVGEDLASAIKLIQENRFQEALCKLNLLTQKNSADSQAWFYSGIASIELGFMKQGTDALRKSIELDPGFAPAHTSLADALLRSGARPGAIMEAEKALLLNPNDERANYVLAFAAFLQNSMEDAVLYAERAITHKRDFASAYLLKAQALIGRYKTDASISDEARAAKTRSRYHAAAEMLTQYVQLVPDSEERTIWANESELLKRFPFPDKSLPTAKDVDSRARVIFKPEPTYTEEARRYQVTGTVVIKATFGFDGTVTDVLVVQALPCGLTEAAVKAVSRVQFQPATRNGQPVSVLMQLEYSFNLF